MFSVHEAKIRKSNAIVPQFSKEALKGARSCIYFATPVVNFPLKAMYSFSIPEVTISQFCGACHGVNMPNGCIAPTADFCLCDLTLSCFVNVLTFVILVRSIPERLWLVTVGSRRLDTPLGLFCYSVMHKMGLLFLVKLPESL